jgi:hypothetical protein
MRVGRAIIVPAILALTLAGSAPAVSAMSAVSGQAANASGQTGAVLGTMYHT